MTSKGGEGLRGGAKRDKKGGKGGAIKGWIRGRDRGGRSREHEGVKGSEVLN
jgi:hypothetical protein